MSKARYDKLHAEWQMVRLRRPTVEKLRQLGQRLSRYYGEHPRECPPFLDGIADGPPSVDAMVTLLLLRDDLHAARSSRKRYGAGRRSAR